MILRDYQQAAVCAVYDFLRNRSGNPVVVIPTGGGKTPILSRIAHDAVVKWGGRVLILAHVKELLQQAAEKLEALDPSFKVGVYSAGLGRRDTDASVIIAGIQSVYNKACELGRFDLIIVDEAHLIPPGGDGMYRTFLADAEAVNPHVRLIGLTATPYRMSTGLIYGDDCILTDVAYEIGVRELVVAGYLAPLVGKRGLPLDTSGLHIQQGEFRADEAEALMMGNVGPAVDELLLYTVGGRQSVLVFCAGVAHAVEVANRLAQAGQLVAVVCGDTPDAERAEAIERFKTGDLKYLVNVNVLTTGFDAPNVDCVALLRPTLSPGLYYQMAGRGFRLHPGKSDCLILDFGGNVERHGPVDAIEVKGRSTRGRGGEAPAKACPQCATLMAAGYQRCPDCGYEFEREPTERHEAQASEAAPLSTGEPEYNNYTVTNQYYSLHRKKNGDVNAPPTLRVDYETGVGDRGVSEWICIEHPDGGFAKRKARQWWERMSDEPFPESVEAAVALGNAGKIREVVAIRTKKNPGAKFAEVCHREIGDYPPAPADSGGWDEPQPEPSVAAQVAAEQARQLSLNW